MVSNNEVIVEKLPRRTRRRSRVRKRMRFQRFDHWTWDFKNSRQRLRCFRPRGRRRPLVPTVLSTSPSHVEGSVASMMRSLDLFLTETRIDEMHMAESIAKLEADKAKLAAMMSSYSCFV